MSSRADIMVRREGQTLVPVSAADAMLLEDDYPAGKVLRAKLTYARSSPFNRRYWAILGRVVDNFDDGLKRKYPTSHKLHKSLLISLGFVETVWTFDGHPIVTADSAAFDKMTAQDFHTYYEMAMTRLREWLGYDPEQWMENAA